LTGVVTRREATRRHAARARVRCYAELNDLLPKDQRGHSVTVEFDVSPSVKDVIERLGVPHTEVDLIVVDGRSVDFSFRVQDGDHIAVYPRFRAIDDVGSATRVRAEPLPKARFVLDTHLGRLARYLRLGGFDTEYEPESGDRELARASVTRARTLLTRDRGLLERREVTHGYLVRATDPRAQFVEVLRRFALAPELAPFTRCIECNGALRDATAEEIVDRVPDRARHQFDRFRACPDCGRVYWEGSHHAQLAGILEEARLACAMPERESGRA
jgi:uncharacterized protein with PIN domain